MSKISYVSPNDEQIQIGKTTRTPQNDLSKDAFMQLLVTQLQYQDPLNPMDNQAFMAQMAQFSALEQMMNISNATEKSNAYALVGKTVEATFRDPGTGSVETIFGNVDSVRAKNNTYFLSISGKEVEIKDVNGVIDSNLISDVNITSGFELIGKTVQATVVDKETNDQIAYEGEVIKIVMISEKPYIMMGEGSQGVQIPVDQVQNVVDKPTITGKHAVATLVDEDGNETTTIEGIVEYLKVINNNINVSIGGILVPFEQIKTVTKG